MDLSHGAEYEDFRLEVREFLTASWPPEGCEDRLPTREEIRQASYGWPGLEVEALVQSIAAAFRASPSRLTSTASRLIKA